MLPHTRVWVKPRVAAVSGDRRPLGHHWEWWRREACKVAYAVDDFATYKCKYRVQPLNFLLRDGEVIGRQHSEVRELARHYRPLLARLIREPRAAHGIQP